MEASDKFRFPGEKGKTNTAVLHHCCVYPFLSLMSCCVHLQLSTVCYCFFTKIIQSYVHKIGKKAQNHRATTLQNANSVKSSKQDQPYRSA